MAVDEHERHELREALAQALGARPARILMDHLPPGGWSVLATKEDLAALTARIDARLEGMEARLEGMEARLEGTEARIDGMKGELKYDLIRWMVGVNVSSMVAITAIVLGVTRVG